MGRVFRIKIRIRRFTRKYPWLTFALRSFMIFSAAFGGAYGFIAGSRSEGSGYDPHAFAIGASFLFALACVALATLSVEEREAIALRYGADLTVPEIAKLKGEKLTTIEGRVYRALRKLKNELD